jgi:hypothetical protein
MDQNPRQLKDLFVGTLQHGLSERCFSIFPFAEEDPLGSLSPAGVKICCRLWVAHATP